jgi:dihydrofolate reductase
MRKLIASVFVSLDGFIVGPNEDMGWVTDNFSADMGKYAGDLQASMGAIVLGRVTYQIMTNYWPTVTEDTAPGAERMNNVPKVVFSRTLDKVEWGKWGNARLVKDNVVEEVTKMKQASGGNMVIYGSANLIRNFTQLGLIDEYQLLVHPVILGGGKPLFAGMSQPVKLNLLQAKTFDNGVVVLYYAPAK